MIRRIRNALGTLAAKAAGMSFFPRWAQHAFRSFNFRLYANEGYKANAVVFAALRVWDNAFGEPELHAYRETDDGKVKDVAHPIRDCLRGNPWYSESELFGTLIAWAGIGGVSFAWKERANNNDVRALWPLHRGQMWAVPGGEGYLSHYAYDPGTGHVQRVEATEVVPLYWARDPLNPLDGVSPLMALAHDVDTMAALKRYIFLLLKNDAVPRGVVSLKTPVGDKRLKEMKEQFEGGFGGDNVGRVAFLQGTEADYQRVAANLNELAANVLYDVPEAHIAAAFEVPAVLLGVNVGVQRAIQGAPAELERFWVRQKLAPRWRRFANTMTTHLLPDFDDDPAVSLEFDLSRIESLQENRDAQATRARSDFTAGLITRNMALMATGREPVPDGDVYLMPSSAFEVPSEVSLKAERLSPGALMNRQLRERRELARSFEDAILEALQESQDAAVRAAGNGA